MKNIIARSLVVLTALGLSSMAAAESYAEVWVCTLDDDKTVEDVQAVNSKWLAYVHANLSEDITSSIITAVVGDLSSFRFVDTYPDLETWANAKSRLDSDEADEIDELFEGVSTCSSNVLYKSEPSK
jgi:hypothetical protein